MVSCTVTFLAFRWLGRLASLANDMTGHARQTFFKAEEVGIDHVNCAKIPISRWRNKQFIAKFGSSEFGRYLAKGCRKDQLSTQLYRLFLCSTPYPMDTRGVPGVRQLISILFLSRPKTYRHPFQLMALFLPHVLYRRQAADAAQRCIMLQLLPTSSLLMGY